VVAASMLVLMERTLKHEVFAELFLLAYISRRWHASLQALTQLQQTAEVNV